ncbi:MAG: DUF262 domain-containing protein [bacterium]|nr:DUF262 domain-containing HNH endonuclease family protein [Acidimicrobiia bacterium]MCY4369358.1 DUF262 domain-containing protein [bacterium]
MDTRHIAFLELFNSQVQYVVPRWQRRYCWGESDIERLVEDLLAVAESKLGSEPAHYGGTLLTFPESRVPAPVTVHRVVDGQQRLTTVSILLACIAEELGPDGECGVWTGRTIMDDRLTNPGKSADRFPKLRLQDGDEDEYRSGLDGIPRGPGAVAQAWRIARRLVRRSDIALLLKGLERLRVVSIGLGDHDDPQQIFESLNATGRPLTESEKLKNWLLMGLEDAEQQELHDRYWKRIEALLGAEYSTDPIDIFLRDFLRWQTGELRGVRRVYEDLRRWAVRSGRGEDRRALIADLADLAAHYGVLTGASQHPYRGVERGLRHLRAMGFDTHRPLTLRLLHEAATAGEVEWTEATLSRVLAGIGTWVTRFWLSDRPMAGMNKAFAELAHRSGPSPDEDPAEFWLERIRRLRNWRVEVPDDEAVRAGIRSRKAYGGSATRATKAVLCAMMDSEQRGDAPARRCLTVEHVMPRKLTDEWRSVLGEDAERIHKSWCHQLANLTLSGVNPEMGAKPFAEKRAIMERSGVLLTRQIADEEAWDEAVLRRRAEELADRALSLWPWSDPDAVPRAAPGSKWRMRWRIDGGDWHQETYASQMVLNVAGALLSHDSDNAERLHGEALSSTLQLASRYRAGSKAGTLTMRAVPGHESYVLYPYRRDFSASAAACREMGNRCGTLVEVEFQDTPDMGKAFWRLLEAEKGGLPGQGDGWRGWSVWTRQLNELGDMVGVSLRRESIGLYLRASPSKNPSGRAQRMVQYSRTIRESMADQELDGNEVSESENGRSVSVLRTWDRDDQEAWPEAALWIKDQADRLHAIAQAFR